MAIDTHIHYLPLRFQAAEGTTADGSGICFLPDLLSIFIAAGAYVFFTAPLMGTAAVFTAIDNHLLHTLILDKCAVHWVGYQTFHVGGFGMGF